MIQITLPPGVMLFPREPSGMHLGDEVIHGEWLF